MSAILKTLLLTLLSSAAFAQTYEIPVDGNEDQARFARFQLQDLSVVQSDGMMTLTYSLPVEMTGLPNKIELTGTLDGSKFVPLAGKLGNALCDLSKSTCRVHYKNLNLDADLALAHLESLHVSPEEIAAKISIGAQFRADPIGIVKFH